MTDVDPVAQAIGYVDDGYPPEVAAETFGVDLAELRTALAERRRTRAQTDRAPGRAAVPHRAGSEQAMGRRNTWDTRRGAAVPAASTPMPGQVVVANMAQVVPKPVRWLWPGYIARGKLHVLDGDPGLGKSTVALDLAARLTVGKPWPDGHAGTTPRGVLILTAEDDLADTVRPRLDVAGADARRVFAVTAVLTRAGGDGDEDKLVERLPLLPNDVERLATVATSNDVGLIIVDPLMAYLGGDVNSYRDQDVRRALAPLVKVAESTDAAVLVIRHLNKGGGTNAIYRGGGSIGIIGAARMGFLVTPDPDDGDRRIFAPTKANIAVTPPSLAYRLRPDPAAGCARVVWDPDPVPYTADDLLQAAVGAPEDRAEHIDAARWLRSYLTNNGGEAQAVDIFTAGAKAGFKQHSLQRSRRRAGVRTRKEAFDAGWTWVIDLEGDTKVT